MTDEPNRLATRLPDSVLDRYYAEHPAEVDFRKTPGPSEEPAGIEHDDASAGPQGDRSSP